MGVALFQTLLEQIVHLPFIMISRTKLRMLADIHIPGNLESFMEWKTSGLGQKDQQEDEEQT